MPESDELRAVQSISEALFQTTSLDDLLERALRTALSEVGAESGSILLADPEREQLIFRCSTGESPIARGTAIAWDRGIVGSVFQSGQPAIIADVKSSPLHDGSIDARTGHTTRNMISMPLKRWGGEPIGVLNVLNKRTAPTNDDLALLTIVSALTALAIQQTRLYEEAKLAEVARMVGNIGHDLKNLLTPIISGSALLREELVDVFARVEAPALSRELCFESLDLIQRTSERVHHRVKEIADCVKGRSTPPVFAPCSIGAMVADVFATLETIAAEQRVELIAVGLEALPRANADERRLYTAIYNLVLNAIPETPAGGTITVRGESADHRISLFVIDTGAGMTPDVRDALFTGRAVSSKSGGTGLGTKIVKDVIDAHRGSISVTSEPGKGTTFAMILPLDPEGVLR